MDRRRELAALRAQGLLPFQAEVVIEFLKSGSESVWEVASPPGTGKTRLAAVVAQHVFERCRGGRVLVLVPKTLGVVWTDELSNLVPAAMWVDRRKLIELAASAGEAQLFWPVGTAIVMSIDLTKRKDVLASLRAVDWDLAIADESHLLAGKRADAFFGLLKEGRARRGLLLTSVPSTGPLPFALSVARRIFRSDEIKDWEGRPLFVAQQPAVTLVTYERSAEELALLRDLEALVARMPNVVPVLQFQAALLVRAASSSLYAAEQRAWRLQEALRHMRNVLAHGRTPDLAALSASEDEASSDILDLAVSTATRVAPEDLEAVTELAKAMEGIVERFGDIPRDGKLEALRQLLGDVSHGHQSAHVCIWTGFTATSQYLTEVLEGGGLTVLRLTAATGLNERMECVARFRAEGGILLTSGPGVEGLSLPFVDTCVHYDLPVDPRSLEQRLGAFLRYGRTKPIRSIVLRDAARGLAWEEVLFQRLAPAVRASS